METTVALDCMGGDHGVHVTVPAALRFLRETPDVDVVLVGLPDVLAAELKVHSGGVGQHLRIHAAHEVVAMDEPPAAALRGKKNSSIRVAIDLVRSGEADACVSAGNTGALMAMSRFVLKMLPGIERPAIASVLPTMTGHTLMLDLGANVDCTPQHLLQFGVMGSALVSAVDHIDRPSIGLLNIGHEDIKGNDVVKRASELLKESGLNFYGNVEGDDIYKGTTDVVVCDGFVGNVALKTSEGLARMLRSYLRGEFEKNFLTKLSALLALPAIKSFQRRFDPRRYNGATLVGLRGVVVKSHGSADSLAFRYAIERAYQEARNGVVKRIEERMAAVPAGST